MAGIPTRTLREYMSTLPMGNPQILVGQDLTTLPSPNATYIPPRVYSVPTIATLSIDAAQYDMGAVTAQAGALLVAAPSNPNTEGQRLVIRIRDNGTPRAITWSAVFSAYGATDLPNTTVANRTMIYEFVRNVAINRWELIAGNPVPRP